mgnify:CR=1 FL=1
MKLKNSYILLIAMALFLLVSIGSACAADTGTSDAGILTDDSSSATLSEDTNEKIETTVVSENVKVSEKDPVEIPVTVKDNESKAINVAKENITQTKIDTSTFTSIVTKSVFFEDLFFITTYPGVSATSHIYACHTFKIIHKNHMKIKGFL